MTYRSRTLCAMAATILTTLSLLSVDTPFLLGAMTETGILI
jgi:hypothetical protein